jgi:hypothetical protein
LALLPSSFKIDTKATDNANILITAVALQRATVNKKVVVGA